MNIWHRKRLTKTENLSLSRRNLFALGGAVTAGVLVRPGSLHAAPEPAAAQMEHELGSVKIRDVLSAAIDIEREYPCNLIKITTDSGLCGLGEARPKIQVSKLVGRYKGLVIGEDPLRVDYLTRKMTAVNPRPERSDLGVGSSFAARVGRHDLGHSRLERDMR